MTQRAAAPTAVMAADIANAVAMTLTHSQIDTVRFQSAPLQRSNCQGTGDVPLPANTHGATRFTGEVAQCFYIANNRMQIAPAASASEPQGAGNISSRIAPFAWRHCGPEHLATVDLDQAPPNVCYLAWQPSA